MPFTELEFKSKLRKTNPTEKAIGTLTKYIIHNRKFHKEIQNVWLYCFRKATIDDKLKIIYVINHTLQEAKKTKPGLEKFFAQKLEKIFELLGSDKNLNDYVIKKTSHVLHIWSERKVLEREKVRMYDKLFNDKSFRKKWAKKNAGRFPRVELGGGDSKESRSRSESRSKSKSKESISRSKSASQKREKERGRSSSRKRPDINKPNTPEGSPTTKTADGEPEIDLNYSRTLYNDGTGLVESKKLIVPKKSENGSGSLSLMKEEDDSTVSNDTEAPGAGVEMTKSEFEPEEPKGGRWNFE